MDAWGLRISRYGRQKPAGRPYTLGDSDGLSLAISAQGIALSLLLAGHAETHVLPKLACHDHLKNRPLIDEASR